MSNTIFDKIISGEMKSWKVWEDDTYLAFLTPFPNTPGFTVVIPKQNLTDYIFNMNETEYADFMLAVKKVAKILEKALDVTRVAMVFEGTGVPHVHAKLIPLYGELANQTGVWSKHTEFHEEYQGHITTAEGPQMSEEKLNEIAAKIRGAL